VGLPGLNGFVAELLIILGVFKSSILFGILVASGALLGAICMLWMYERVFFGKVTKKANSSIKDLSIRELAALIPLILIMFWIGLFPGYILNKIGPGIEKYTTDFSPYTEIIEMDENASYNSNLKDLIKTTSKNNKLENSDAGGLR
jgi:NADH:ubiquinone oxidoreductase subunit 4 (subunit M)